VELHPLDDAPAIFDAVVRHAIARRVILKHASNGNKEKP
jgi:hypothetical protein